MSSFETIKRANPYGIEDDVLKLTIDSAEDSYRLPNLITEPDTYVFVIWHRTDTPCTISFDILGETVTSESSSQWTKVVKVKKVTDLSNKNIDITPPVNSTTYYYEAYLARGSVDTSWTPAPEDNIEDIIGLKSEIKQTAERIDLTVGNLQGQLAELSIRADNITSRVESVEGTTTLHSSQITQIPEQITQQVNDAKKELSAQIKLQSDEIVHTVGKNHATAIRYIRDWLNGSNLDTQNRWAEINVMSNNENIASGIVPVCKNEEENNVSVSYLERYTDGDTSKYIESTSFLTCPRSNCKHFHPDVDSIYFDVSPSVYLSR